MTVYIFLESPVKNTPVDINFMKIGYIYQKQAKKKKIIIIIFMFNTKIVKLEK